MNSLRDLFDAVAFKRLVPVDLPERGSHQHELNGARPLQEFFDVQDRTVFPVQWYRIAGDEIGEAEEGTITFYDARKRSAARTGRSEWRAYYTGDFLGHARPGDLLLLLRRRKHVHAFLVDAGSPWVPAVAFLLGLGLDSEEFEVVPTKSLDRGYVDFARRQLLETLGFEVQPPSDASLEATAERLVSESRKRGLELPSTDIVARAARGMVRVNTADLDAALLHWLNMEEQLFRAMERRVVLPRLRHGFSDVDDFVQFAKTVTQRRRARMGLSLQHHIAAALEIARVPFEPQAFTEGRSQPDFLFPSRSHYADRSWPEEKLAMLAVKSTAKDRWRQILAEAARIRRKHLFTLEAPISEEQMGEMTRHDVQLVIPARLHEAFKSDQRMKLWSFRQFVEHVRRIG